MATSVVSATAPDAPLPVGATDAEARGLLLAGAPVTEAGVASGWVEDAVLVSPEAESFPTTPWAEGVGLAGGNSS